MRLRNLFYYTVTSMMAVIMMIDTNATTRMENYQEKLIEASGTK